MGAVLARGVLARFPKQTVISPRPEPLNPTLLMNSRRMMCNRYEPITTLGHREGSAQSLRVRPLATLATSAYAEMEAAGIDMQIISLTAPGVVGSKMQVLGDAKPIEP